MTDNRSRRVLTSSIERRMRNVMVRMLSEFDKRFDDTDDGNMYKIDLKHAMNDMIRATRDEISDYNIDYRPISIRSDNTLSVTKVFMESIERVEFESDPYRFRIVVDKANVKVLDALRSELCIGATFLNEHDKAVYVVSGMTDCLSLLPFLDKYRLVPAVRTQYVKWRTDLVYFYARS